MEKNKQNKKYDIIYSIGNDCACASYMKLAKLRSCSGPFDWLTGADFQTRFELMLNDFKDFFNKEDLEQMPKPKQFPPDKNNDYYKNIKTGLCFWHDFPKDKSFDEVYPLIKEKYLRRIDRFYNLIKKRKRVLIIWFSHLNNTPDEVVIDLCNKFSDKMCSGGGQ